ncbi:hypothetical protein WR25_23269 [Diploscapter pachys]|uniref:Uncharacterized protein n=1 Tax=Diploscapter pachys TaxID=2018661 RepID=A0A2A2KBK2_9BILA|nr:hypothetical protein WR25_23269 [Diploscapter pachys]
MRLAGAVVPHMAGMMMAVVDDLKMGRLQRVAQALRDDVGEGTGGGGGVGHRAYIARLAQIRERSWRAEVTGKTGRTRGFMAGWKRMAGCVPSRAARSRANFARRRWKARAMAAAGRARSAGCAWSMSARSTAGTIISTG